MDPKEETHFRALAARANYLALNRMDLQYATKDVVQRHSGADEGICEEIEEAHPIPH